ncbi:MAG: tetratricopeptide repeat protein [Limisphaerales bacterium]
MLAPVVAGRNLDSYDFDLGAGGAGKMKMCRMDLISFSDGRQAKMVKWFRKAAEQNNATAQCGLGVCYATGCGVEKDYVQAYKWLNLAASQGVSSAIDYRNHIASSMTPDQIAEGQRLSTSVVPRKEMPGSNF